MAVVRVQHIGTVAGPPAVAGLALPGLETPAYLDDDDDDATGACVGVDEVDLGAGAPVRAVAQAIRARHLKAAQSVDSLLSDLGLAAASRGMQLLLLYQLIQQGATCWNVYPVLVLFNLLC